MNTKKWVLHLERSGSVFYASFCEIDHLIKMMNFEKKLIFAMFQALDMNINTKDTVNSI